MFAHGPQTPTGVPFDGNAVLRETMDDVLHNQLGFGVRPIEPKYNKSYLDWIDMIYPWPRNYKIMEFSLFTGSNGISIVEHIWRFTLQCGEVNDFHKLILFHSSLLGMNFS